MGSTLHARNGTTLKFNLRVADSAGLQAIRIVSQGRVVKEILPKGDKVVDTIWKAKAGSKNRYFRLESAACDDRRAFSTPIYVEPA